MSSRHSGQTIHPSLFDPPLFLQTHPNVDKKLFNADGVVALKNQSKPFPLNQDIGVLKWRFQTQDDSFMPLSSQYRSLRVPSASIRDQ